MNKKNSKSIVFYILILVGFAVLLLTRSPLSPGATTLPGCDSSVFMYMSKGMSRGLVPYRDLFDHKGILIYMINFVGMNIFHGSIGVWIIEILFMLVDFFIIWKIASLFTKENMIKFFTVIVTFLPYLTYYGGGNRVEEFATPFILLIIYEAIKYLNGNIKKSRLTWFIIGLSTAGILWLKPNMVVVDIVYGIIVLYSLLKNKNYKEILNAAIYIFAGIFAFSLPILVYLISNNALKHCFEDYILFNLKYVGDKATFDTILYFAITYWKMTILSSVSAIICIIGIIRNKTNNKKLLLYIAALLLIILSYYISAMSGREQYYYAGICIPAFAFPVYCGLEFIMKDMKKNILTFITIFASLVIVFCGEIKTSKELLDNAHLKRGTTHENKVANYIKKKTDIDDEVIVIGNKAVINLLSDRYSSSKYFFQVPVADIDDSISEKFMNWLTKNKPKILVLEITESTKNDSNFRNELFTYLNKAEKKEIYKKNTKVSKKYVLYERTK